MDQLTGATPDVAVAAADRPYVLVLSFSNLARDPRVNRQIRFLSERYRIIAAGYAPPDVPGVEFVPVELRAKSIAGKARSLFQYAIRNYDGYYWRQGHVRDLLERLANVRPDIIVANDLETLPLALRLAAGAKVVFDAHEYAPLEWEDLLRFRLFEKPYRVRLCQRYIPQVDAMLTVCQSIADTYERDTGVRPVVITNAPDYEAALEPSEPEGDPARIRLVHHGGASPSRKLELMIEMMALLDERFELDFLLTGNPAYTHELQRLAAGDPRIRFLDPVPMRELPRFLNRYDAGVYLLAPTSFNNRYALPNKLFEFIQARLAVVIGPSPEMARVVREAGCGVVAEDFTAAALATSLRKLDRGTVQRYKQHAHAAALELSAERNREILFGVLDEVLARPEQT
jgi:glycosyltransferase involved in cell wall biosynthesis